MPCRSACSWTAARTVVALHASGVLLVGILALGLHVKFFARVPRELYRMVAQSPALGARVVVSVGPVSAALARARGYLGPGPYAGGVPPVLKRVVAVAGDLVEGGPEAVTVNGQRLPGSSTAASDGLGREPPRVAWGRYVVGVDELWLVSRHVPSS